MAAQQMGADGPLTRLAAPRYPRTSAVNWACLLPPCSYLSRGRHTHTHTHTHTLHTTTVPLPPAPPHTHARARARTHTHTPPPLPPPLTTTTAADADAHAHACAHTHAHTRTQALFNAFVGAPSLVEAVDSFAAFAAAAEGAGTDLGGFTAEHWGSSAGGHHRARQLFEALESLGQKEGAYAAQACKGMEAVVIGAGPAG